MSLHDDEGNDFFPFLLPLYQCIPNPAYFRMSFSRACIFNISNISVDL